MSCPPRPVLLIVQRPEGRAPVPRHVEHLFAALDCVQLDKSIYALPRQPERDRRLRRFAKEWSSAGGSVWLFLALDEAALSEKTYRPLRDRTEHYREALIKWREGREPLPELMPGELLRL